MIPIKNLLLYIAVLIVLIGCNENDIDYEKEVVNIDFEDTNTVSGGSNEVDSVQSLKLAIAAMTSPKETYKHYQELIKYLSDSLDIPIELSQKKTYSEVNDMLETEKVDVAFICSGSYVALDGKASLDILAVPLINNTPYYHSYIITHKDNGIDSLPDLKGRSFAYTDPLSNTGYIYALYLLKKEGYLQSDYFSKTIFTHAHDHSIQAVNRKIVQGACVHSTIFNYIKKKYPNRVKDIKVINKSEPFGMPPIVARSSFNIKIKARIVDVLIDMKNNSEGRRILENLLIDEYVHSDSTDYSSVRSCFEFLNK